jgi:PAS domain S-box-containing protein
VDEAGKRIAELERRLEAGERAARALADSERLYRALFEGTQSAVTIRSLEDQSFIECNAAALHLYRADTVEMLRGSKVTDLSANEQLDGTPSPQALRNVVARAIQNGTERCEWLARRLDGSPFIADVRIAILELEGGRRVMQTMIEDITDKKAGEDALRRRAERDELVGRISRRFLDGGAEAATRFAIE